MLQELPNKVSLPLRSPPANTGSDRAIRNVKVKAKESGQFQTMEDPEIFAILRTVIDSAFYLKCDPFMTLYQLVKGPK
jgi:hypothetical protein